MNIKTLRQLNKAIRQSAMTLLDAHLTGSIAVYTRVGKIDQVRRVSELGAFEAHLIECTNGNYRIGVDIPEWYPLRVSMDYLEICGEDRSQPAEIQYLRFLK